MTTSTPAEAPDRSGRDPAGLPLLIATGVALGSLAAALFANHRVAELGDRIEAAEERAGQGGQGAERADAGAGARSASPGLSAAVSEQRLRSVERRLALLMTLVEGEVSTAHRKHDSERRRLAEDIARLRVAVRGLTERTPDPSLARADATAAEPDAGEPDAGKEDVRAPATEDTPAEAPAEADAEPPPFVRRDELLQAIREETITAEVSRFAIAAGLDPDQAHRLEAIVSDHRAHHQAVIESVRRGEQDVRDAGIELRRANERRDRALGELFSRDQLQRFGATMNRLDELWWRY